MNKNIYILAILACVVTACGRQGRSPTYTAPGLLDIPARMRDPSVSNAVEWSDFYTVPWNGPAKRHYRITLNDHVVFDNPITHEDEIMDPSYTFSPTRLKACEYILRIEDLTTHQEISETFNPTNTLQIEILADPDLRVSTSPWHVLRM
jgi:hypothetical protein